MTTLNHGHIPNLDILKKLVDGLGQKPDVPLGFDVETGYDGPDRLRGALAPQKGTFIVGFSLSADPRWARYVPLRHDFSTQNLDEEKTWDIMRPLLEQKRIVAHNAKFEKSMLRTVDIDAGLLACTMLEAYVLADWPSKGLKYLVSTIFGHQMTELEDLFPNLAENKKGSIRFNSLEVTPDVVSYACGDAAWCLALHHKLYPRVLAERKTVFDLEMSIIESLVRMETHGLLTDFEGMKTSLAEAKAFIPHFESELVADFGALVGENLQGKLKLNSHKQMRELMFERLAWKTTRLTKSGELSTDAVAMEALSKKYPAALKFLELREARNMENRLELYLDMNAKKPRTKGEDGRVHTNYSSTVVTGRFAANDPPIQQCPRDWFWCYGAARAAYVEAENAGAKEEGRREAARQAANPGEIFEGNFRDFIVASPDHYLIGFDYSQIELRVFAGLSQEPYLLKAFESGDDVHTLTAAYMLGKNPKDVDPKTERPVGKTMNFALLYGMGAMSLADRLAITLDRAKDLFNNFFASVPTITAWVERQKTEGRTRGYTVSWIGRKCMIWELASSNRLEYSKGERLTVNAQVQGGAADYVKLTMHKLDRLLEKMGWQDKVHLIMNQHDALYFEVHKSLDPGDVRRALLPVVEWEPPAKLRFPHFSTDWEFGQRWGSMQKVVDSTEFYVDPETDEWKIGEGPVGPLPSDDTETHRDAMLLTNVATAADHFSSVETTAPQTVVVQLKSMPAEQDFARFLALAQSAPGTNSVLVRTPQGEVPLPVSSSLSPDQQASVSMLLPGARVFFHSESIDTSAIAANLSL